MQKRNILIICMLLAFFIMPVSAAGIKISPTQLSESGSFTITNTGSETVNYKVSLSQIMQKNGAVQIIDNVNADIQYNPATFTLAPGASQKIDVTVGDTKNLLYGVRVTEDTTSGGIKMGVSAVLKIASGQVVEVLDSLSIRPIYFPVSISGVPISVTYDVSNPGNVPTKFLDTEKTLYPGDSLKVDKSYDNGLMNWGFVNFADGVNVFVIPSPILLLILVVGVIFVLRRKVSIQMK